MPTLSGGENGMIMMIFQDEKKYNKALEIEDRSAKRG